MMVVLLIAANVAVYLYQSTLSNVGQVLFVYTYAAIPLVLLGKFSLLQALHANYPGLAGSLAEQGIPLPGLSPAWLSIFTSMFMHGSLVHLAGNMLYLWIFGNNVEDILGHFRFLVFYLVCGMIAAATQILLSLNSPVPMLGASGAIAGVLGAYYLRFPNARVLTLIWFLFFIRVVYLPASLLLLVWFLMQLLQATSALGHAGASGGVAVFAHLGGFAAGWLLIRAFAPAGRGPTRRREWE